MIIIPEIETVVILVPRTGSGSLRRAIRERYPQAMQIYRHMEADGVPAGYDLWPRVGVVRHPVDRLWSLYKFLLSDRPTDYPDYVQALRASTERWTDFNDWLLHNETVFTCPHDYADQGRYYPQFNVRHALPENRKSQFLYLRPDLGTKVYPFRHIDLLRLDLGLSSIGRYNGTANTPRPALSAEALQYVERVFAWDFRAAEDAA